MESEIEYITCVQQLGAYPLAFYQQFINTKYIEPINLFPLIPTIKEIASILKTKEDKEKWREDFLRRTKDDSLIFFRGLNLINKNHSKTSQTKSLGNLINTLI